MTETEQKLKQAAKLAGRGKISRREFTQLALASGLTLAAANTMFTNAARAEPKKGGTFKLGLAHGATTDSMDPGLYLRPVHRHGAVGHAVEQPDRNRCRRATSFRILPKASSLSDGAKKWVFKLRKGMTFHNGKPVTADDVVASFMHHRGEDSKSAAKSLLEPVDRRSRPTAPRR